MRKNYDWLVFLVLGLVVIAVATWAYMLEQRDDIAEQREISIIQEKLDTLTRQGADIGQIVTLLASKPSARPLAFDACAGAALVEEMRKRGMTIGRMEFEERCAAGK